MSDEFSKNQRYLDKKDVPIKYSFAIAYKKNDKITYESSKRKYNTEFDAAQAAKDKGVSLKNDNPDIEIIDFKIKNVYDKKQATKIIMQNSLREDEIFVEKLSIIRKNKKYSIEEILSQFTYNNGLVNVDGDLMYMNSHRYENFLKHGVTCVCCGIEGKYFYKERYVKDTNYHFNLYAVNERGDEILMTKDHIIPKSLGGKNEVDNYQPMCTKCNRLKGSTPDNIFMKTIGEKLKKKFLKNHLQNV